MREFIRDQTGDDEICGATDVAVGDRMSPGAFAETGEVAIDTDQIEARIWEMEATIFEGRGRGDLSNYLDVTSSGYLGWPPVMEKPLPLGKFRASADSASALKGEKITFEKEGFTIKGGTAITYFTFHRTRLGDGFAPEGEREVDQQYENAHI